MELRTEIEISAPPAAVWEVLTDFARYPEWNPFLVEVQGSPKVGGELRVAVSPPDSREYHLSPRSSPTSPSVSSAGAASGGLRSSWRGSTSFGSWPWTSTARA